MVWIVGGFLQTFKQVCHHRRGKNFANVYDIISRFQRENVLEDKEL